MKTSKGIGEWKQNSQRHKRQGGFCDNYEKNQSCISTIRRWHLSSQGRKVPAVVQVDESSLLWWALQFIATLGKWNHRLNWNCVPLSYKGRVANYAGVPESANFNTGSSAARGPAFLRLWWLTHAVNGNDTNYCEKTVPCELQSGPWP